MSASSSAARRQRVAAGEVVADPLRLRLGQRHRRAERLQQREEVQAGQVGVEDAPVERQLVVGRGDAGRVEEREADLVARAVDDDVGRARPCRRRRRRVSLVSRAMFGLGVMSPWVRRVRIVSRDRRVRLERAVVGLGQAVALHVADRGAQRRLHEALADRAAGCAAWSRTGRAGGRRRTWGRSTRRGARRGRRARRRLRRLDRDVHRRVAHPEHDHALAGEQRRVVAGVVVRVHLHARRRRRRRGRPARASAGPSGGRWRPAARRSARVSPVSSVDPPAAVAAARRARRRSRT